MVYIELEPADNGIVVNIKDDNINGASAHFEKKKVYDLSDDEDYQKTIRFLSDLIDDLGLECGNKYSSKILTFGANWGSSYIPNAEDIKEKIKLLKKELAFLDNKK